MDQLINIDSNSLTANEISPEHKYAFLEQVKRLLAQGETVWHSTLNTPMIIFEARSAEHFVGMQSQTGNLQQIIIDAAEGDKGYRIYYNHYLNPKLEPYSKEIVIFEIGTVSSQKMYEYRINPKYSFGLENKRPGTADDLVRLTSLLKRTEVEPKIQKKVVDEIVKRKTYRRRNQNPLIVHANNLLGRARNLLK